MQAKILGQNFKNFNFLTKGEGRKATKAIQGKGKGCLGGIRQFALENIGLKQLRLRQRVSNFH